MRAPHDVGQTVPRPRGPVRGRVAARVLVAAGVGLVFGDTDTELNGSNAMHLIWFATRATAACKWW